MSTPIERFRALPESGPEVIPHTLDDLRLTEGDLAQAHSERLFAPLIAALRSELDERVTLTYDVENTGGHVMCLFIRRPEDWRYVSPVDRYNRADRCVVFGDVGLDEPDPTAPSEPTFGRYYDWSDADDTENVVYMDEDGPRLRYTTENMPAIARWAAPLIVEWLTQE